MADQDSYLQDKVIDYLEDAHAMEKNVLKMLESMIKTTSDTELQAELKHHKEETEQQEQRIKNRLTELGCDSSTTKDIGAMAAALFKAPLDMARSDKAGKNARDGFATEHMEIASYELLERVAKKAGDEKTAQITRQNCKEEEAMAKKISSHWDKVAELSLKESA